MLHTTASTGTANVLTISDTEHRTQIYGKICSQTCNLRISYGLGPCTKDFELTIIIIKIIQFFIDIRAKLNSQWPSRESP
jgi:hypothetical protein